MTALTLNLLPGRLAVAQLPAAAEFPLHWDLGSALFAFLRTPEELTVICDESAVPAGLPVEPGWRAFRVAGPLDFSLVGVLAQITAPLAQAGVSIFAASTFSTDFILVKEARLAQAVHALKLAGMIVEEEE
jgi:hypothetical protein